MPIPLRRELEHGPLPTDDGWRAVYALFDRLAPVGSARRSGICLAFRPKGFERAGRQRLYRFLGVHLFGAVLPTGGVAVRRWTGARMRPYTLAGNSARAARDFYYRTCVFEALHLPFLIVLLGLTRHRPAEGRLDLALEKSRVDLVANLYPMLHLRETRARILDVLERRAAARTSRPPDRAGGGYEQHGGVHSTRGVRHRPRGVHAQEDVLRRRRSGRFDPRAREPSKTCLTENASPA